MELSNWLQIFRRAGYTGSLFLSESYNSPCRTLNMILLTAAEISYLCSLLGYGRALMELISKFTNQTGNKCILCSSYSQFVVMDEKLFLRLRQFPKPILSLRKVNKWEHQLYYTWISLNHLKLFKMMMVQKQHWSKFWSKNHLHKLCNAVNNSLRCRATGKA